MVRLGFNIHGKMDGGAREYSAEEKAYLGSTLHELNASAILMLDDWGWAQAYRDALPNTLIVYRRYHPREGDLWNVTTPEQYFEAYKQYSGERIILNIGNEPDGYMPIADLRKMVTFYVRLMELFGNVRIPIAIPAWGVGNPDYAWFTDMDRMNVLKPLLEAFKRYSIHHLNLHEYCSYKGLEIGNGRVGRHTRLAELFKAHDYDMPPTLITEWGLDKIDESGIRTWQDAKLSEDAYADWHIEAQRLTYNAPYIKGVMTYCWGSTGAEWKTFDVSKAKQLHKRLIAANKEQQPPVIQPIPAPPLPTPLGEPQEIRISGNGWRLRSEATDDSPKVGTLRNGEFVDIYPATATEADSYIWHIVKRKIVPAGEAAQGWSAYPVRKETPTKPLPPPPPPVEVFPSRLQLVITSRTTFLLPAGVTRDFANALVLAWQEGSNVQVEIQEVPEKKSA